MKAFTLSRNNNSEQSKKLRFSRPRLPRNAWKVFALMVITMMTISACQAGAAPPQEVCDLFEDSLFTVRLFGTAALLLSLAILGFKKQLSNILPSQGAQTGAVASSAIVGLALLAFSTSVGGDILATFGLDAVNMFTLCGL